MDPNTALTNLLSAINELDEMFDGDQRGEDPLADLIEQACESGRALDGWLSKGGFLPTKWEANRAAPFTIGPMYAITATYSRSLPEIHETAERNGQVPTFYLHPNVQGILNEDQAARIAQDVLTAGTTAEDGITYHVTAVRV